MMITNNLVNEILNELNGRSGFDDWWYELDYDIQNEIIEVLENIVKDFINE